MRHCCVWSMYDRCRPGGPYYQCDYISTYPSRRILWVRLESIMTFRHIDNSKSLKSLFTYCEYVGNRVYLQFSLFHETGVILGLWPLRASVDKRKRLSTSYWSDSDTVEEYIFIIVKPRWYNLILFWNKVIKTLRCAILTNLPLKQRQLCRHSLLQRLSFQQYPVQTVTTKLSLWRPYSEFLCR